MYRLRRVGLGFVGREVVQATSAASESHKGSGGANTASRPTEIIQRRSKLIKPPPMSGMVSTASGTRDRANMSRKPRPHSLPAIPSPYLGTERASSPPRDRPPLSPLSEVGHLINITNNEFRSTDQVTTLSGKEVIELGGHLNSVVAHGSLLDGDFVPIRNRLWGDLANKQLPPENTELMIRLLEKSDEDKIQRLRRTYVAGQPLKEVHPAAVPIKVGITFLAGADGPQVARLEQKFGSEVDLKGALWKVNTAGLLLTDYHVSPDLSVVRKDQTLAIATKARSRLSTKDLPSSAPSSNRAVSVKGLDYDVAVTIDSDNILVVQDLKARRDEWDVEGTLIEVDGSSLMDLMLHYRHLISRGGPDMSFQVKKDLLETMIDDARRLVLRSPILFRMSTRVQIISSKNTRYGVDYDRYFQTLATSKGIRETISLSAAYFDSLKALPGGGTKDDSQAFLRPKFLQMIVLLLSLLNDDDLAEISEFLETTYNLGANRRHLELLFLKVMPLMSINPTIFLRAMDMAYFQGSLNSDKTGTLNKDQSDFWDHLISQVLKEGCLLPGVLEDLGRERYSWVLKWPKGGLDTSTVFNNLQYSGNHLRAFNEVPPLELRPEAGAAELSVIFSDDEKYTIASNDLESLTCLVPGTYTVVDADGNYIDLRIHEHVVNEPLKEAIDMLNAITVRYNEWVALNVKGSIRDRLVVKRTVHRLMDEYPSCGRLTLNSAVLGNKKLLASCCKFEGRKITRNDAVTTMTWPSNEIEKACENYEAKLPDVTDRRLKFEKTSVKADLNAVRAKIRLIRQIGKTLAEEKKIPDETIKRVLYPVGVDPRESVWFEYEVELKGTQLRMKAQRTEVQNVEWISDELAVVKLGDGQPKIFVAPLEFAEDRDDEIMAGDTVLLVGQYLIVAAIARDNCHYNMTNYMRIKEVEVKKKSRRNQNRDLPVDDQYPTTDFW